MADADGDWASRHYAGEDAARLRQIYDDYHTHLSRVKKANPIDPDMPEPGIYRKTFEPPKEWGEITERMHCTSPWGRPCEGLLLAKHGWIKRLMEGVQGYD
jgi:hypothetical protein